MALIALLAGASGAVAESISLNQCLNGAIGDEVDHLECYDGWTGGNANAQKATFVEGGVLPYRVAFGELMVGQQYTYTFSWDTEKGDLHAIDYIATYNHSVTNADACQGLDPAICAGTIGNAAVPIDGDLPFGQISGEFTLFGGTIDSVGAYSYPDAPDTDVRTVSVVFTPDQSSAVLAWGGHLSSPLDWGDGTTAADIHGSPYHVSNVSLTKGGAVVAGGGQDVALSAGAVYVPSAINVMKTANKDGTFYFESSHNQKAMTPEGESNPWTLQRDQQKSMMAYDDGTVVITESAVPEGDWRINSITCSRLGSGTVFSYQYGQGPETSSAVFDTGEASTYSCVFDNYFFGAPVLDVVKKVIDPDDECTDAIRDGDGNELRGIRSGETVKYCYWVTNTGTDNALDVVLIDDMGSPGDVSDDVSIVLAGGSDIDGQLDAPDLASGQQASGSLNATHNIALGTTVTNVAEGTGIGETDGLEVSDSDTASVVADQVSSCTLTATASTNGSCPGNPTAWVLEDDSVTWCANVSWDGAAVLPLTNVSIELVGDASVSTLQADMNPGDSDVVVVGSNVSGASDFTGTLQMTGMEGGLNPITCTGQATVDVVAPGLNLLKTVMPAGGTCGVDDQPSISVITGESVQYCLMVANTGDTPLTEVLVEDSLLNLSYAPNGGSLTDGEFSYYTSEPYTPTETMTNTAVASATEPLTGTPMGPEMSSATVEVLYADIKVNKSVDLPGIVICEYEGQNPWCSQPNLEGKYDATYQIVVSNLNANTTATNVVATDTLPTGFEYLSDDAGCDASSLPTLTCNVGDIAVGGSVTINVTGQIDTSVFELPWGSLTNEACANPAPTQLDPNPGNNCDDATTSYGTGPARSAGYWGTHPDALGWCTDQGPVRLGYIDIVDELDDDEVDAMISTDVSVSGKWSSSMMAAQPFGDSDAIAARAVQMAKGLILSDHVKWTNGQQRSVLDQARTKASRQLTAAWCNEQIGSSFAVHVGGWPTIWSIMSGQGYLDDGVFVSCGGYCTENTAMLRKVIASMDWLNYVGNEYNNSGHHLPLPDEVPQGQADPHYPDTDPTDPTDSVDPAAVSGTSASSTSTTLLNAAPALTPGKGNAKGRKR